MLKFWVLYVLILGWGLTVQLWFDYHVRDIFVASPSPVDFPAAAANRPGETANPDYRGAGRVSGPHTPHAVKVKLGGFNGQAAVSRPDFGFSRFLQDGPAGPVEAEQTCCTA